MMFAVCFPSLASFPPNIVKSVQAFGRRTSSLICPAIGTSSVKVIGVSVVFGVLLALAVIWWLSPLNAGAVGLVVVLSIGLTSAVGQFLSWIFRSKSPSNKN